MITMAPKMELCYSHFFIRYETSLSFAPIQSCFYILIFIRCEVIFISKVYLFLCVRFCQCEYFSYNNKCLWGRFQKLGKSFIVEFCGKYSIFKNVYYLSPLFLFSVYHFGMCKHQVAAFYTWFETLGAILINCMFINVCIITLFRLLDIGHIT